MDPSAGNGGVFSSMRKNCKQSYSMITVTLLMMCFGLTLQSILYNKFVEFNIFVPQVLNATLTLFFVGAVLGAGTASFVLQHFEKSIHYYICGGIVLINGIIYTTQSNSRAINHPDTFNDLQMAVSFFSGLSFGICLLTAIIHGGEIAVKEIRGSIVGNIQLALDVGIFLAFEIHGIIYQSVKVEELNILNDVQAQGIMMIIASILSFVTTYFMVIESAEFLLRHEKENEAKNNLIKLRRETMENMEIVHHMNDIREALQQHDTDPKKDEIVFVVKTEDLIPLAKVLLLRLPFILGTGIQLNLVMLVATTKAFHASLQYGAYFMLMKILGELIGLSICDRFGRKILLMVSLGLSGLLIIVFNTVFLIKRDDIVGDDPAFFIRIFEVFEILPSDAVKTLCGLALLYQLALGSGSSVPHIYMSESFALERKSFLIALIIIVESILYIVIIVSRNVGNYNDAYFYITAVIQVISTLAVWKFLPETAGKKLMECNKLMQKLD